MLLLTFIIIIFAIRNYKDKKHLTAKYAGIAITLILSSLLITLSNLLFINFDSLYIVTNLLIFSLIFLKVPLIQFVANKSKNKAAKKLIKVMPLF